VQSVQNDDERNITLTLVCAEVVGRSTAAAVREQPAVAGMSPPSPAVAGGALD
jgi:hypothetical protein